MKEEEGEESEKAYVEEEIIFFLGVNVLISKFSQHSLPSKNQESLPSVH